MPVSIVFVDVRNSTELSTRIGPTAFAAAMRKFYAFATGVFYETDGFVMDLIGDEVMAVYPPGFSGAAHAKKALDAAKQLVCREAVETADGLPMQLGVGVHTGLAFVGTVSHAPGDVKDVPAQGQCVNLAARLAAEALPREALLTEQIAAEALEGKEDLERRELRIKGKDLPVNVLVYRGDSASAG